MTADPLSTWLGFLTSPTAPKGAMSPMELDGYLTGIVVSPDLLVPSRWLARIWGENEPTFDGLDQMQTIIAAVMDHYKNAHRQTKKNPGPPPGVLIWFRKPINQAEVVLRFRRPASRPITPRPSRNIGSAADSADRGGMRFERRLRQPYL
jgi:Uncharacterised protein family (UPF0149)